MQKRKIFLSREAAGAILTTLFAVVMAFNTGMRFGPYPMAVFVCMAAIGIVILICLCLGKMTANPLALLNRYEILFIAILIACLPMVKPLGFYTAGACALFGLVLLTRHDFSLKGLLRAATYVVCVSAGVYLIFTLLLKIPTPRGLFL